MNSKNIILVIFCTVLFSGCAVSTSNVKLEKQFQPKQASSVNFILRKSPLNVVTPFKAVFFGFNNEGDNVVSKVDKLYNDDEGKFSLANYLNVKMSEEFSQKYNLSFEKFKKDRVISDDYEIKDFIGQLKDSDYIVDNYVTDWRVMYYKLLPGYFISLTTKMRIIDVKTKKVISEGFCQKETEFDKSNVLSYEKLFDNNGEGLKIESKKLAEQCLSQYRTLI